MSQGALSLHARNETQPRPGRQAVSRYARKVDTAQAGIIAALEKVGCNVTDMSGAGNGCPDLFVTRAGTHYVLEVKSPTGKLTPAQVEFHDKHQPVHLVRTEIEALASVGL
jgi:Holliday junction resolvase